MCFVLVAGLLWLAGPAFAETAYFRTIDDLPLMTGMQEDTAHSLEFDTPQGRIVQAVAQTTLASSAVVAAFYAGSLPSLGWVPEGGDATTARVWLRAAEKLSMTLESIDGVLYVRFDLAPVTQ